MLDEIRTRLDSIPHLTFESAEDWGLTYGIPALDHSEGRGSRRVHWMYSLIVESEDTAFVERNSRELGTDDVESGTLGEMLEWIEGEISDQQE